MSQHVELHQAYTWVCDSCAQRNYVRAVRSEDLDIPEGQSDFYIPEKVQCSRCATEYYGDPTGLC